MDRQQSLPSFPDRDNPRQIGRPFDRLNQPRALFDSPDNDGPGRLSVRGIPRHDNDHEDFRQIQILPTVDEILSISRSSYVPTKTGVHFLPPGPQRLLDIHFRQLRYDSTEKIRAICYEGFQQSFHWREHILRERNAEHRVGYAVFDHLEKTLEGHQYFLYHNVEILDILSHESKSLLVAVSYDCPPSMRGRALYKSGRFDKGMLVALLGHDTSNGNIFVWYFEVHQAQTTMAMDSRGGGGLKAAVQLEFIDSNKHTTVKHVVALAYKLYPCIRLSLVEFPRVLYAGFHHCLDRLKSLRPDDDIAFLKYIAADSALSSRPAPTISAPAYSMEPGFTFELNCLPSCTSLSFNREADADKSYTDTTHKVTHEDLHELTTIGSIQNLTTLDRGQVIALRDALVREFSLVQGPPGTGKTFLGVALTKVLRASRPNKPILLVCLTNHALDSFMSQLKDAGVKRLVRIGSGSKEEWTKAINVKELSRKQRFTRNENVAMDQLLSKKKQLFVDMDVETQGLRQQIIGDHTSWTTLMATLQENDAKSFAQLAFSNNRLAQSFTYDYWLAGGDLKNINSLSKELGARLATSRAMHEDEVCAPGPQSRADDLLQDLSREAEYLDHLAGNESIWNLPLQKRKVLVTDWAQHVDVNVIIKRLVLLYQDHQQVTQELRRIYEARHTRLLQSQDVIGITTTACAAKWEHLKHLGIEIMICEEAGEVLEAHTLTSLLPTLKHAIFIGDPEQLRPQVEEQVLSLDRSGEYRLDESLFERLSDSSASSIIRLPTSRLTIQRRMYPQIADIARLTYPFLEDHVSTRSHPPTSVLRPRMFWLDHRCPEKEVEKSFRNDYEVDMATAMVHHLLKSGRYTPRDIAVLATYNGQLKALCDTLQTRYRVMLDTKDQDLLHKLNPDEPIFGDLGSDEGDEDNESAMVDMLRVATIDNFQGEEAKIVILTTVRSGFRAGFMSSPNRINVACSRARDGFYIIGDASTLQQVTMWKRVIDIFVEGNAIGANLFACCERHPNLHKRTIQKSMDLSSFEDCQLECGIRLQCGHVCPQKCHPFKEHANMSCLEPCVKTLPCSHACSKQCFSPCGPCTEIIERVSLPCGHEVDTICSATTPGCLEIDHREKLACGHEIDILCGLDNTSVACMAQCGMVLTCGHLCTGTCSVCNSTKPEPTHPLCSVECGNILSCKHKCASTCHTGQSCPPCEFKVTNACEHGTKERACHEPINFCTKPHLGCSHITASGMCCLPNLQAPCSEPCLKILACGHLCPSLCGEPCPPQERCYQCTTGLFADHVSLYMPACGHLFRLKDLDALNGVIFTFTRSGRNVGLALIRDLSCMHQAEPKCTCGVPCRAIRRYALINQIRTFHSTFDQMLGQIGHKIYRFGSALRQLEKDMLLSFKLTMNNIRPNPLAAKSNYMMLMARDRQIDDLKHQFVAYRKNTVDRFQAVLVDVHGKYSLPIPGVNVLFHTRLDVLEYRAMGLQLNDLLAVARHLLSLNDPSFEVQRQAERILRLVSEYCSAYITFAMDAQKRLKEQDAPALQCELLLYQVQFKLLNFTALRMLTRIGGPPAITMPANPDSHAALLDLLRQVGETAKHYPAFAADFVDIAGKYKEIFNMYKIIEIDPLSAELDTIDEEIPKIKSRGIFEVEKRWGDHIVGNLTACGKGHPYSKSTFEECFGCPECGLYAESLREQFRQNGEKLREQEFLNRMRDM